MPCLPARRFLIVAKAIPLCCPAAVAEVKVPGKEKIDAARGKSTHRHMGSPNEVFFLRSAGQIERVMAYDNLDVIRWHLPERLLHSCDLPVVDATTFDGEASSGV